MQLKVVWNLRLHADPEGPSLIFDTAWLSGLYPSFLRDTLAARNNKRPDAQ
jgi:hypothetical protein